MPQNSTLKNMVNFVMYILQLKKQKKRKKMYTYPMTLLIGSSKSGQTNLYF